MSFVVRRVVCSAPMHNVPGLIGDRPSLLKIIVGSGKSFINVNVEQPGGGGVPIAHLQIWSNPIRRKCPDKMKAKTRKQDA